MSLSLQEILRPHMVVPAEVFNLKYNDLKALTRKFHPDTGQPVVTQETLDFAGEPTLNPLMVETRRPAFGLMGLSLQRNLRTTAGALYQQKLMGGDTAVSYRGSTATSAGAQSATQLTDGATQTWTAGQWAGHIAVLTNGTYLVFGRITGNTVAGVVFVDQWYDANSATFAAGTAPAATGAVPYVILPGQSAALWIALTTTNITPAAGDTLLSGEANANGISRSLATWATVTGTSYKYTHTWTFTGAVSTTFFAAGMFTGAVPAGAVDGNTVATGGGTLFLESSLSASATVSASGDQIAATWTVNI